MRGQRRAGGRNGRFRPQSGVGARGVRHPQLLSVSSGRKELALPDGHHKARQEDEDARKDALFRRNTNPARLPKKYPGLPLPRQGKRKPLVVVKA